MPFDMVKPHAPEASRLSRTYIANSIQKGKHWWWTDIGIFSKNNGGIFRFLQFTSMFKPCNIKSNIGAQARRGFFLALAGAEGCEWDGGFSAWVFDPLPLGFFVFLDLEVVFSVLARPLALPPGLPFPFLLPLVFLALSSFRSLASCLQQQAVYI